MPTVSSTPVAGQLPIRLGIIEGFFGRPWTWDERRAVVEMLAPYGYCFYHYAPKADPFLRRRWTEPHPLEEANQIKNFAQFCARLGVGFGVGLSPYEAFNDFNQDLQSAFVRRVEDLVSLSITELGIFFDDMHVDQPDLAKRQIEITHLALSTAPELKLNITPSFYSDDPVLERVFGKCPPNYLADLGAGLDPSIDIYWTGEEVCAREISPGHLKKVGELLKRKPLLWDNYPVNDGPRMSQYLHLRGFTGRPAINSALLAGHAINPASQAILSCIPAITLSKSYELGDDYCYAAQGYQASRRVVGDELAAMLRGDLLSFQDMGLSKLEARIGALCERYGAIDHPGAREIVAWLSGDYDITGEQVQTQ
jgi:hyaluronoglucosaminidase